MIKFIEYVLFDTYFGPFIFIIIGYLALPTKKDIEDNKNNKDIQDPFPTLVVMKGWAAGIGFIVLGLIMLYQKLTGKV